MTPLLRQASPEDLPLVLDAVRRSLHDRYPWVHVHDRVWATEMRPRIAALVERSRVVVACDPDAPAVVWGFALCEPAPRVLHYVYVKYPFRGFGVARAILESVWGDLGEVPITVTAMPDGQHADELARHRMAYNPFLGLFAKESHGAQSQVCKAV